MRYVEVTPTPRRPHLGLGGLWQRRNLRGPVRRILRHPEFAGGCTRTAFRAATLGFCVRLTQNLLRFLRRPSQRLFGQEYPAINLLVVFQGGQLGAVQPTWRR
ncbi:hypothetical protein GCM10017653_25090 [Ancylobacter defluvii]|uniref:Uncharacterized protein n=1 Tax=Ancylobacter defluvii TaxID=1282440 RepID=A0A9W6JYV4_9HYPH|nr:hypothetical protein GCM10017653_25090 [Ancylobacter defluvii]